MIRLQIGDQVIAIEGRALAQALIDSGPQWMVGTAPPPSPTAAAIKSGIKAVLPMLLAFIHKEARQKGSVMAAPDLKSVEARASVITYAIRYLVGNFAASIEGETYVAQTREEGGEHVIVGIVPASALMAAGEREDEQPAELAPAPVLASLD